ncbi:hypothetical protein Ocin01_04917 [Orchesella cincta]|uniref:Uncharacterized protein n=1 Tax=Orchesella cincta TaxID=48709 RepID=A0A1D2N941_ORCCI|nr:hypothetical protein Ocin01_04917 [Orchesella cincta]
MQRDYWPFSKMLKMKGSSPRRGEYFDTGRPMPPSTAIEQLQRVADWTKNSHALPPSMGRKTAKQFENEDHEEKSQLIVEAVRMLDTRDKQIRSKPTTARQTAELLKDDADISIDEDHQQRIAKLYVKDFGEKLKQRRYYEPTMLTSLPVVKGRKGVGLNRAAIIGLNNPEEMGPVVEPESWRFKASRSMKFTVKPIPSQGSNNKRGADSISESDEKWTLKPENDRDWWKWKLKQGFLQNDELLQKLVSQRHTLEATFKPVERLKEKQKPVSRNASLSPFPSNQNSSRHVTVQIPFQSKLLRSKNVESSSRGLQQPKTREPIPNFYHPPKSIVTLVNTPEDPTQRAQHKPVSLKQDPYLSKLLAGSQMFKPEAMLDVHQPSRRHEFTQQNNINADNLNRKISLESLTDSDDDYAARKFFTPDIKVLYERLSDNMENLPTNPTKEPKINSREPSDGYINLPILLATGRFSRFNKLPSMKAINEPSKGNTRKTGMIAKVRTTSRFTNNKFVNKLGNAPKHPQSYDRIEDLPTKDWAKKVMEKVNKQGSIIEERSDSGTLTVTTLDNSDFGHPDHINMLQNRHSNNPKHIDQEMNMLYHDILMSKWKKDKHDKEVAARKQAITKLKKGVKTQSSKKLSFNERKDFSSDKPRGLDIWLENIREKAKRDRVISPHDLNKEQSESAKNQPPPPLVTTFANTSFSISRDL